MSLQIDPVRFVAFTAWLAATSCGRGEPPARATPEPSPLPPSTASARSGVDSPAAAGASGDAEGSSSASPAAPPADKPPGDPDNPFAAGLAELAAQGAQACGPPRPPQDLRPPPDYTPEEWHAPPRGVALECGKLTEPWAMPGPHCESWSLTCERGMEQLRPEPARRAMRCLQAKNHTRAMCGFDVVTRCVWQAMKATRPHPVAERLCKQIVAQCAAGSRHDPPRALDLGEVCELPVLAQLRDRRV